MSTLIVANWLLIGWVGVRVEQKIFSEEEKGLSIGSYWETR